MLKTLLIVFLCGPLLVLGEEPRKPQPHVKRVARQLPQMPMGGGMQSMPQMDPQMGASGFLDAIDTGLKTGINTLNGMRSIGTGRAKRQQEEPSTTTEAARPSRSVRNARSVHSSRDARFAKTNGMH